MCTVERVRFSERVIQQLATLRARPSSLPYRHSVFNELTRARPSGVSRRRDQLKPRVNARRKKCILLGTNLLEVEYKKEGIPLDFKSNPRSKRSIQSTCEKF